MKFNFFSGFALSALALLSCAGPEMTVQNGNDQFKKWHLEMSFPSGLRLTDDELSTGSRLFAQLRQVNPAKIFFRDPALLSENSTPFDLRLTVQDRLKRRRYQWQPELEELRSAWTFASCRTSARYAACEYTPLLECLQRNASESELSVSAQDAAGSSNQSRSLLMEWSKRCGIAGLLKADSDSSVRFEMRDGRLFFEPSPLLSVLIYSGAWSGYEDAVVQATAAASVPAVVPCNRADGACLESPVSLSACQGCEKLVKGRLYTVFFVETLRQDYAAVRSAIFVP